MIRPRDARLADRLENALLRHAARVRPLPGIQEARSRRVLIEQLLDSVQRVRYVRQLLSMQLSDARADPSTTYFDPLKASVLQCRLGEVDEAFWLVFLFVHFGKHRRHNWSYVRSVYGRMGGVSRWDWASASARPRSFRKWLSANSRKIKLLRGGFGNHRKYISLSASSPVGTGEIGRAHV